MARPKRDSGQMSALERMEEGFWQLLAERPFDKITITALSKRAVVNHNLIYYYYENLEDLARQMFERNMAGNLPQQLLSVILEGVASHEPFLEDAQLLRRVGRVRLCMRSENAFLNGLIRERLQREWLTAVGLDRRQLSAQQQVDLDFLVSGIIAVVGSRHFEENLEAVATLYQRPLGKALAATLKGFAQEGGGA